MGTSIHHEKVTEGVKPIRREYAVPSKPKVPSTPADSWSPAASRRIESSSGLSSSHRLLFGANPFLMSNMNCPRWSFHAITTSSRSRSFDEGITLYDIAFLIILKSWRTSATTNTQSRRRMGVRCVAGFASLHSRTLKAGHPLFMLVARPSSLLSDALHTP